MLGNRRKLEEASGTFAAWPRRPVISLATNAARRSLTYWCTRSHRVSVGGKIDKSMEIEQARFIDIGQLNEAIGCLTENPGIRGFP